jgi:hypothetical protein
MLLLAGLGETVERLASCKRGWHDGIQNGFIVQWIDDKNNKWQQNNLSGVAAHAHTKHSYVMHRGAFAGCQF